jgi:hypothetical protein
VHKGRTRCSTSEPYSSVCVSPLAPWLHTPSPSPNAEVTAASFFNARSAMVLFNGRSAVKTERFAGHHEAREALVLSIAGVTAIMVTAYLILMILY